VKSDETMIPAGLLLLLIWGLLRVIIFFIFKARRKGRNFNGYVFSFSVRGGTKAFKEYVLSPEGYVDKDGKPADENTDFKIKSRIIARDINVTLPSGKKLRKRCMKSR
jgi:hypothetical protein